MSADGGATNYDVRLRAFTNAGVQGQGTLNIGCGIITMPGNLDVQTVGNNYPVPLAGDAYTMEATSPWGSFVSVVDNQINSVYLPAWGLGKLFFVKNGSTQTFQIYSAVSDGDNANFTYNYQAGSGTANGTVGVGLALNGFAQVMSYSDRTGAELWQVTYLEA
jgi:hypothetical protein